MDLRDYLRMIRRGWRTLTGIALVCLALSALYLALVPKQYEAQAVLLISVSGASNTSEVAQGVQAAASAVGTYADVISSAAVVGPAAEAVLPAGRVSSALGMVSASPRGTSSVIDITVLGDSPLTVAKLANAVAREAVTTVPRLQGATSASVSLRVRPLQGATVPVEPASPIARQVLAVGLIFGLAIGLILTIAQQALDTRIRRPDDVRRLGEVLLGVLPKASRNQRRVIAVRDGAADSVINAYRVLRTSVSDLLPSGRGSVVITGVSRRHDVDNVAANLAWSFAQSGKTVLLVDADLDLSPLAELLQQEASPGLSEVLSGFSVDSDVIRVTGHPGVHVVPAGIPLESPADLLSRPRIAELLGHWKAQYDLVLINAPSVMSGVDALILARQSDATMVRVDVRSTRAKDLFNSLQAIRDSRVAVSGMVLVGVAQRLRLREPAPSILGRQPATRVVL
jgi:succinoglycan biosynthesis transport protein ExoP